MRVRLGYRSLPGQDFVPYLCQTPGSERDLLHCSPPTPRQAHEGSCCAHVMHAQTSWPALHPLDSGACTAKPGSVCRDPAPTTSRASQPGCRRVSSVERGLARYVVGRNRIDWQQRCPPEEASVRLARSKALACGCPALRAPLMARMRRPRRTGPAPARGRQERPCGRCWQNWSSW